MEGWCPWVLFSHWRSQMLNRDLSEWCCTDLEEEQCSQHVAISLTFLRPSVAICHDLCGSGGASASLLCSRILSVASRSGIVISHSFERKWSQKLPMSPSWWHHSSVWILFLSNDLFIYLFETETEIESEGNSRGPEGERTLSRLHSEHGVQCGGQSHDPQITTQAETKSQILNQLSHPGTPGYEFFNPLSYPGTPWLCILSGNWFSSYLTPTWRYTCSILSPSVQ